MFATNEPDDDGSTIRKTDPKLPHCPPEPGGQASYTLRRNSSSSSMPKSYTRYFQPSKSHQKVRRDFRAN
eukprot:712035-Pyramimonas_sp.AAC.1